MYIPEILKVKTLTHREIDKTPIAYVTYLDEHNKLRNEKSWTSCGKAQIPDVSNIPLKGYKIFDDVTKRSSYFGSGRTMFNIRHPGGFFFEISSDNLASLVCNCEMKNGEIQDECVLAWDKTSLAVLPTSSNEYQENVKHTDMINAGTVKISDLKIGTAYCDRNRKHFGYYAGTAKAINFDVTESCKGYGWSDRQDFEYSCKVSCRILHVFVKQGYRHSSYAEGIANPKVFIDANTPPDLTKIKYDKGNIFNSHLIEFPDHLKTVDDVKEFIMKHPKALDKLENPRCVGGYINYGFSGIKKMLK